MGLRNWLAGASLCGLLCLPAEAAGCRYPDNVRAVDAPVYPAPWAQQYKGGVTTYTQRLEQGRDYSRHLTVIEPMGLAARVEIEGMQFKEGWSAMRKLWEMMHSSSRWRMRILLDLDSDGVGPLRADGVPDRKLLVDVPVRNCGLFYSTALPNILREARSQEYFIGKLLSYGDYVREAPITPEDVRSFAADLRWMHGHLCGQGGSGLAK